MRQHDTNQALAIFWCCPECGAIFFVALASSTDAGGVIVSGVKCSVCGAFVPTDEDE